MISCSEGPQLRPLCVVSGSWWATHGVKGYLSSVVQVTSFSVHLEDSLTRTFNIGLWCV